MKWIGIVTLILGIVALVLGLMAMMAMGWQAGLATLLLGLGLALAGFALYGLMSALAKMAPPK